jgi:hypothetical protein
MNIQPTIGKPNTSPRDTKENYGLTSNNMEINTPLRGKRIGHSNGVRLIVIAYFL